MLLISSILVGVLFGLSVYLFLQKSFVRILFGAITLSNAANLAFLTMSGDPVGREAPITIGDTSVMVDPLPQALVLTAIVIAFGITSYMVFLLYRIFLDWKTTNVAELYAKTKPGQTNDSI